MADSNKIHRMRHPDGHIVHVREEDVIPLAKLGYHVPMTSPDGQHGFVPINRTKDAGDAGFTFGHKGQWR
jgi:hypothetical protein